MTAPDDPDTVTGVVIHLTDWGGATIVLDGVTSTSDLTEVSFRMPAVNVIEGTDGQGLLVGGAGMDDADAEKNELWAPARAISR